MLAKVGEEHHAKTIGGVGRNDDGAQRARSRNGGPCRGHVYSLRQSARGREPRTRSRAPFSPAAIFRARFSPSAIRTSPQRRNFRRARTRRRSSWSRAATDGNARSAGASVACRHLRGLAQTPPSNTISFGGPGAASYTGGELAALTGAIDDGDQWSRSSNGLFEFSFAAPVTSVTFGSSANSLEVASVASAVPEASTWAMMLIGFTGLGYAAYRKTKTERMAFA